jgi:hypothetical protein
MNRQVVLIALAGPVLTPVASRADAIPDELATAARAISSAASWRSVSTKGKGTVIVEYVKPDRTRLTIDGQETIRIGPNVWGKTANGWQQLSAYGPGKIAQLTNISLPPNAVARRLVDESDGTELAHVYLIDGYDGDLKLRWFVRISDGRVHKITGPGGNGLTMTMTIDDYNARFTIEPPL